MKHCGLLTTGEAVLLLELVLPARYLVIQRGEGVLCVVNRRTGATYCCAWSASVSQEKLLTCVARWRESGEPGMLEVAEQMLRESGKPLCLHA